MAALAERGALHGRVLNVGCGTGEHALLAARVGLQVVGIDTDAAALNQARTKAAHLRLPVTFLRHDARHLDQLAAPRFDTALDCQLFHALTGADRSGYLTGPATVLRVGGRLLLLCYADSQPDVPHRVSRADLLTSFRDGWRMTASSPQRSTPTSIPPAHAAGSPS